MHVMQLKHISQITVEKLLVVLPVVAVVLFHKSQFKHSTLSPPKTILAIESLSVVGDQLGDIWRHLETWSNSPHCLRFLSYHSIVSRFPTGGFG